MTAVPLRKWHERVPVSGALASVPRVTTVVIAVLILMALIAKPVWDAREQWYLGQSGDDAVYWASAKSLADGAGYRVPSLPGQPFAVKYPPVYPLYLSIAWRIDPVFPRNLRTAALLQALLVPISLLLFFLVLQELGLSWRRSFLAAALSIVSFQMILLAATLFSELLCASLLFGAILALERSVREADETACWWAVAGGLLTGLAYLTRNAVLPMFAAVPVFFWVRRKFRLTSFFLACSLPMAAGWHWWTLTHSRAVFDPWYAGYSQEYFRIIRATGFWTNLGKQAAAVSGSVAESFSPRAIQFLAGLPLYHLVLAAAIAGGIRIGRKRQWPLALIFTGMYLALVTLWWYDGVGRLLVLVLPILFAGVAEEASHVASLCANSMARSSFWSKMNPWWRRAPRWALLLAGALIVVWNDAGNWARFAQVLAHEHELRIHDQQVFAWVAAHAQPDTVVLAWKDPLFYLYTSVPASRGLFTAMTPQRDETKVLGASFSDLPGYYKTAILVVLASDLAEEAGSLEPFRARAVSVAGSRLEYDSPAGLIYSFPIPRAAQTW